MCVTSCGEGLPSPACAPLQLGAPAQVLCWGAFGLRLFAGVGTTVVELALPALTGADGGTDGAGTVGAPRGGAPTLLASCDDEVSCLSAHGDVLAAADDSGAVTLVDTSRRGGARVLRRGGHTSLVTAVLLGGGVAVSGGCDARVLLWDAGSGARGPVGEALVGDALAAWRRARRCAACGEGGELSLCSRCRGAAYCDAECQARGWAVHKVACKAAAAAAAAAAASAAPTASEESGVGDGGGEEGPPTNWNPPFVHALAWVPAPAPSPRRAGGAPPPPPFSLFAAAVGDGSVAAFEVVGGARPPGAARLRLRWAAPRAHAAGACALALVPRGGGARPLLFSAGGEGGVRWWEWGEGGGCGGAWAHGGEDARGRRVRKVNWLAGSAARGGLLAVADTSSVITLVAAAALTR